MRAIHTLCERMQPAARDARCNLESVLTGGSLEPRHRWGALVACAVAARHPALRDAALEDASAVVDESVIDDARAAAAQAALEDVILRSQRMAAGDPGRSQRLRMSRMAQPRTSHADFAVFCFAAAALLGSEPAMAAHEWTLRADGMSQDEIDEVIRIAAAVAAAVVALEMGTLESAHLEERVRAAVGL